MNLKLRIITLVLGMMTLMPGFCFASSHATDSTLLPRIWNYRRNYSIPVDGIEQNVYMRYGFTTDQRNALLFLVPTMYVIAKGDRQFLGESYCKLRYTGADKYEVHRQVVWGTIPRQRTAMPAMLEFSTPNFYDYTIYPDRMLSPFHEANHYLYYYVIQAPIGGLSVVHFYPRAQNTQLVSGQAVVEFSTGRLQFVQFEGESDMIQFKVSALMNNKDEHVPIPGRCTTNATFKFLGNKVTADFTAVYNCPQTLPDSLERVEDGTLMASLRPIPLNALERKVYAKYDSIRFERQRFAHIPAPSVPHHNWLKEIGWDVIGSNLLKGNKTNVGAFSMRVSPLLNPLYLGYSPSRGISYKLKLGLQYSWNTHRYLTFKPQIGYNFKQGQFYYEAPFRMNYNPKRRGYAEISWANGNRISNAKLADDFHQAMGDSVRMSDYQDQYFQAINNVVAYDWLEITSGVIYHRRHANNRVLMRDAGLPEVFRSFAPMLTLRLTPWTHGPVLTANYEVGIKGFMDSNLRYERWEFDAAYLHRIHKLRLLNLRGGTGFYTKRNSQYFVDFVNFRDNNLPTGWEDDWTGQFQLLSSRKYNESNIYLRGHVSYDSPMIALSFAPFIGRYIETERLYLSLLHLDHSRPYAEFGYGLKNRLFSTAFFGSFSGVHFQKFGCKFTVELFNRW